jgi:hypothetical protein
MELASSRSQSSCFLFILGDDFGATRGLSSNCTLFGVLGDVLLTMLLLTAEERVVADIEDLVPCDSLWENCVVSWWFDSTVVYPMVAVRSSATCDVHRVVVLGLEPVDKSMEYLSLFPGVEGVDDTSYAW